MISQDALFLIDTNVILEAARTYYHPTRSRMFWDCLETCIKSGQIVVLQAAARETLWPEVPPHPETEGFASRWLRQFSAHFHDERKDQAIFDNLQNVYNHLRRNDIYRRGAEKKWDQTRHADPLLVSAGIAYAQCTAVSNEKMPDPLITGSLYREPKIPFVCRELGARCAGIYDMMDELRIVADSGLGSGNAT